MAQLENIKLYVHRDKDSNYKKWEHELGQPENDAGRRFSYTGYEIELTCEVDLETGIVNCTHVDKVPLEQPITIS